MKQLCIQYTNKHDKVKQTHVSIAPIFLGKLLVILKVHDLGNSVMGDEV